MDAADAIRGLRATFGETQEQFARRIGKTNRTVARYESGKQVSLMALAKLHKMAKASGGDNNGVTEALYGAILEAIDR